MKKVNNTSIISPNTSSGVPRGGLLRKMTDRVTMNAKEAIDPLTELKQSNTLLTFEQFCGSRLRNNFHCHFVLRNIPPYNSPDRILRRAYLEEKNRELCVGIIGYFGDNQRRIVEMDPIPGDIMRDMYEAYTILREHPTYNVNWDLFR